jgi:NAD(P)-dependent dehydrogenase (short-subunit alcohol dehydrogenase family)
VRWLFLVLLAVAGCGRNDADGDSSAASSRQPDDSAREQARFDSERRPEKVVEALGIGPGSRVADIGAGSGLLTVHLARAVKPSGRVVATDIDGAKLAGVAEELKRRGGAVTAETVDVADLAALRGWVAEAADALGGLDIFVANVSALAQGMDEESWRKGFEIDVMGTVFGIEAALPFLEKSAAGSIVAVGSTAMAEVYGPTRSYAAVKATLIPYVKGLARNLAAKNVRANIVSPGNVYFKGGVWNVVEERNPEMFGSMLARNPMGRMGTPEEVASAVVFLASPRASFITGTNLIIDGALTQRVQF